MTLIAAYLTPSGPPMLLSDVLISSTQPKTRRMAGPGGLIQAAGPDALTTPYALEQKCLVLEKVWAAYCGDVIAGKTALSRLRTELANETAPLSKLDEMLTELNPYLVERNSSVLIAAIEPDLTLHYRFAGAGSPREKALPDGTFLIADGTGRDGFIEILSTIHETIPSQDPTYSVLAFLSEVSASESINAAFNDQFGAVVEVVSAVDASFQKMPSLTIATEIVRVDGETASIVGGNYLNYRYIDEVLVYRRFGSIRGDEMKEVFGTDYLAGAIYPPGRRRSSEEEQRLCLELVANPTFNASALEVISWNDPTNLKQRRLRIGPPDHAQFKVERVRDEHFVVFRSHAMSDHIASRFGAKKIVPPT